MFIIQSDRIVYLSFIGLIFLFYHFYQYVEMIPISFLTTFSVKHLGFPIADTSLLMSVFYGFHFAGRLLGVPLSACLRPRTMVLVDLTLTAVAYLVLLALVNVWPAVVWPTAAMAGLAMATTFGTAVLWISDRIPMTGRIAAVLVMGSSLGGVVGPFAVGRLFASTPMWFVYVLVGASVGHVFLFGGMLAFVARFGDRLAQTNKPISDRESDIVVVK